MQRNSPTPQFHRIRRAGRAVLCGGLFLLAALVSTGPVRADEELDFGLETHRLGRIELTGNKVFSDSDLKSVLHIQEYNWLRPLSVPRYRPHLIANQLRLITSFYHNRGFHQAAVALDSITVRPTEEGDILHISVREGRRTYIDAVVLTETGALSEAELRTVMTLQEGAPCPADLNGFGGDIYGMRQLYRNETFLDATVAAALTIRPDSTGLRFLARVTYDITPGRPYTVGGIRLVGNENTNDNLLHRELTLAPGDPLRWDKVEDSRRNLLSTSLFRDVDIARVTRDTTRGEADLEIHVVERKPAFYELGVGVGSLERVRVLAAWGHNNLWKTGRMLQVRARGSWNVEDVVGNPIKFHQGQINYRGDVEYRNPRMRDSRYAFELNLYLKRETRGESGINMNSHGINVGTSWKPSRRVLSAAFVGLKITDSEIHPYAPDSLKARFEDLDVTLAQTRSLNYAIYIDHRDDLFTPASGMFTVGTAKLAGGPMGGDFSFFKWSASWQGYRQVTSKSVLATRVMVGGARPFGSSLDLGPDGVPYDDRFFAGGASTVRGYRHNSLGPQVSNQDELDYLEYSSDVLLPDNPARGGNYLLLTNVELRFPLPWLSSWNLSSVVFFEGGNVWANLRDVRMTGFRITSDPGDPTNPGSTKAWDYRYSFGTGIRLGTPLGPVRVDVGFPTKRVRYVSETQDYKDPKVMWHFSLGYPF